MRDGGERAMIPDPFFAAAIGRPRTPNGVDIPYKRSWVPYSVFEPSSIRTDVGSGICRYAACEDDPRAPGRLDEITYLLERCHEGAAWPWRVAAGPLAAEEVSAEQMPRLVL